MSFQPRDADFEQRVRSSFDRQAAMTLLGATLERAAPGELREFSKRSPDHGNGEGEVVAMMTGTMMAVRDRPDLVD